MFYIGRQLWILISIISLSTLILHNLPARAQHIISVKIVPSGYLTFEFYSPSTVSVTKGDTVTWTNNDKQVTSIMAYGKSTLFDSGHLKPKTTFSYTFSELGRFDYYCAIHPFMSGKVVVQ